MGLYQRIIHFIYRFWKSLWFYTQFKPNQHIKKFNLPIKLVNLIKARLKKTSFKIKITNKASETVRVRTGLKQGDALSPFTLIKC